MTFVGVDTVKNSRFVHWNRYSDRQLLRVFHPSEVVFFREVFNQNAEKALLFIASRYAVKEAFFKAYSSLAINKKVEITSFLAIARQLFVEKIDKKVPILNISLLIFRHIAAVSVSLSHEECCSTAVVAIHTV